MLSKLLEYSLTLCFNDHYFYNFLQIQLDKKRESKKKKSLQNASHLQSPSDEKAILST